MMRALITLFQILSRQRSYDVVVVFFGSMMNTTVMPNCLLRALFNNIVFLQECVHPADSW